MEDKLLIGLDIVKDLNDCISFANEKNSKIEYPMLSDEDKNSIATILLDYYRESKLISLSYRDNGKVRSYTGMIERIDLLYKELFLLPKKKISFSMIVGLKEK